MQNRDKVLEFAVASGVATVSGVAIEVKPPETEEEYKRNHNFWLEVFKHIDELKVDGLPSVSCDFFFQTPDEPIPLTRFEMIRKKLGLRVEQKKKAGEVKETEARHVSFFFLDREAMKEGWLTLCLDKTQHERLRSPGLHFRVILLPITHPYRLYLQAGQLRRLVLA